MNVTVTPVSPSCNGVSFWANFPKNMRTVLKWNNRQGDFSPRSADECRWRPVILGSWLTHVACLQEGHIVCFVQSGDGGWLQKHLVCVCVWLCVHMTKHPCVFISPVCIILYPRPGLGFVSCCTSSTNRAVCCLRVYVCIHRPVFFFPLNHWWGCNSNAGPPISSPTFCHRVSLPPSQRSLQENQSAALTKHRQRTCPGNC